MSEEIVLNAVKRENTGKQFIKKLRREGKVPGIFYGHKEKNVLLSFDAKEIHHVLSSKASLFDIKIDKKRAKKCIIKEVQFDPASLDLLHLDVMGVKLKEEITLSIPIHTVGEPVGVKEEGGILNQTLYELEISCLPLDIPEHVDVDVTDLGVGDTIHVGDIKLDNAEILNDSEVVVVSIIIPRAVVEEEEEAVEEIVPEEGELEQPAEEAEQES